MYSTILLASSLLSTRSGVEKCITTVWVHRGIFHFLKSLVAVAVAVISVILLLLYRKCDCTKE